jgi:SAM-dependent methyltransferase
MPRIFKMIEQQVRLFPFSETGGGILRTARHALLLPYRIVKRYRRSLAVCKIVEGDGFDLEHNIETSVRIHETDLDIADPNWIHASAYFPTPSRFLKEALAGLDIRFEDFTFVDLGSGKGRVLFMASEFPFCRIIGVEVSPGLHAAARRNIASYKGVQRCNDIHPVCMDFTKFVFPEAPLFIFLYNPASPYLINVVARNLMRSLNKRPREAWILYVTPHKEVFAEALNRVREGECLGHPYCLYAIGVQPGALQNNPLKRAS